MLELVSYLYGDIFGINISHTTVRATRMTYGKSKPSLYIVFSVRMEEFGILFPVESLRWKTFPSAKSHRVYSISQWHQFSSGIIVQRIVQCIQEGSTEGPFVVWKYISYRLEKVLTLKRRRLFSVLLQSPIKYKSFLVSPVRLEIAVEDLVENMSVINSDTHLAKNWCMTCFSIGILFLSNQIEFACCGCLERYEILLNLYTESNALLLQC